MKNKYLGFAIKYASKYPQYVRDDMIQEGMIAAWKNRELPANKIYGHMRGTMRGYWDHHCLKHTLNASLDDEDPIGKTLLGKLASEFQLYTDDTSIDSVVRFLKYHSEVKTITINQANCLLAYVWMYNNSTNAASIICKERTNLIRTVNKALENLREFYKEVC